MKVVEAWVAKQRRDFGKVAETSPAFRRACSLLGSERGRLKVLTCMRDKMQLHGKVGSNDYGIEECRTIVDEMRKILAGTDVKGTKQPPSPVGSAVVALEDGQGGGSEGDGGLPLPGLVVADGDDHAALLLTEAANPVADPVGEKAKAMAAAELDHISIHTTEAAFRDAVTPQTQ